MKKIVIAIFIGILMLGTLGCTKKEIKNNTDTTVEGVKDTSERVWTDVKRLPGEVKKDAEKAME